MAFVETPEEWKVVVARMSDVVFAVLENGIPLVREQGCHRRELILGGSFRAVSGDQIT